MTKPSSDSFTVVKASLEICQHHRNLLEAAMRHLVPLMPARPSTFEEMTEETLAFCDQFAMRFCKLQDMLGAKVFPEVLELTFETGDFKTFIDKLNQLEKIGAILSAEEWIVLRETRNKLSHEYPVSSDLHAEYFNKAFSDAQTLLKILKHIQDFVKRHGSARKNMRHKT